MTTSARTKILWLTLAAAGCGSPRASGGFDQDTGTRPATDAPTVSDAGTTADVPATIDLPPGEDVVEVDTGAPPVDVPPPVDTGGLTCRSSRDCSAFALVCDTSRGVCVECVARNDCPSGQVCSSNVCRATMCTPGTATCVDANNSRVCSADGLTETIFRCTELQVCGASGTCVARDRVCTPGTATCGPDGTIRRCASDGFSFVSEPCPPTPNAPTGRCEGTSCRPVCSDGFGNCDGSASTGCETRLQTSTSHCGACGNACGFGASCSDGRCSGGTPTATSCTAVLAANPGAASGPYMLDPDGAGGVAPFMAYCNMTLAGGGWTLVAIITNNDASNWSPRLPVWVDTTTFGNALDPSLNADAKSEAYNSLPARELMVVRQSTTPVIEAQTMNTCLVGRPLLYTMQRDAVASASCAHSCTLAAAVQPPWSGGTCQAAGLHFRCRDAYTATTVGGYLVSTDDNSMISTIRSDTTCDAYQFGLGASSSGTSIADFDSDSSSSVVATDRVARIVYVR